MPTQRQPRHQQAKHAQKQQNHQQNGNNTNNAHQKLNNNKNGKKSNNSHQNQPILTFSTSEEHQANPAQHFAPKGGQNRKKMANKAPQPNHLGNKLKDARNNFMPKHDNLDKTTTLISKNYKLFSAISEEKDEGESCNEKREEMLRIQSTLKAFDDLTVIEDPTEMCLGSFLVRLFPFCGTDIAGCYVDLEMKYQYLDSMEIKIGIHGAEGLADEQIDEVQEEINQKQRENRSTQEVIDHIQDFLGHLNPRTRKVIQQQEAERKSKHRAQLLELQRKQGLRRLHDFEKNQQLLLREEQNWCESVAAQQNKGNSKYRRSGLAAGGHKQNSYRYRMANAAAEESKLGVPSSSAQPDTLTALESANNAAVRRGAGDTVLLDHVNLNSRYANDFEELEEIGRGGFGIVYKARHRLDGNIYAIKKIKLSDKNCEENKRIRREITYLSSLNNQYIVRYFQTWVEHETDKAIIDNFGEWAEDDSEFESQTDDQLDDSFTMSTREVPDEEAFSTSRYRKALKHKRSSSMAKEQNPQQTKKKDALPFQHMAQVDDDMDTDIAGGAPNHITDAYRNNNQVKQNSFRKSRAMTDNNIISRTPDTKPNLRQKNKLSDEIDDQQHLQQQVSIGEENELEVEEEEIYAGQLGINQQDSDFTRYSPEESYTYNKDSFVGGTPFTEGIKILYIQMQYCDGETLEEYLKNGSHGSHNMKSNSHKQQKIKIFKQILEAVNYLHQRDIIHRDIKPENIFLDKNKDVRLGDFGLAKRITPLQNRNANSQQQQQHQSQQLLHHNGQPLQVEQDPAQVQAAQQQTELNINCATMFGKQTTGLGTMRFAAPEQFFQKGKEKRSYCFKADVYSLGIVLLDMFREHDISGKELEEIFQYIKQEKVHPSLVQYMPGPVVTLIEKMIKKLPEERPNLITVLHDPLLQQDEVLNKLYPHLNNHKSSVKLDLVRNLCQFQFPKGLNLNYNGDLNNQRRIEEQHSTPALLTKQSSSVDQTSKLMNKQIKCTNRLDDLAKRIKYQERKQKVETVLIRDFRELFESNGARNMIYLHNIAPLQNEKTIFLSKAIRLQPWIQSILTAINQDTKDQNQSLQEVLREVIGGHTEESIRLLADEFLVYSCGSNNIDQSNQSRGGQDNRIKPLFDIKLPRIDKSATSCWQQLVVRNKSEQIQSGKVFKLIDRSGIAVGLQPELIDAISREIAMSRTKVAQKVYHIGQKFTCPKFRMTQKLAPDSENHACFTLVNPNINFRSELHTLSEMSDDELMLDVEALRICDAAFRNGKLASRYELKVCSSELLDAIFEECNVELEDRIFLLQFLNENQDRGDGRAKVIRDDVGLQQKFEYLRKKKKVDTQKLVQLMQIEGSCSQVKRELAQLKHILCRARFEKVIAYFERLENKLKLFDIYSEMIDENASVKPVETRKEKARNSSAIDNRPIKKKIPQYQSQQSTAVKDTGANSAATQCNNNTINGSSCSKAMKNQKLVFDFGLVLEEHLTYHSGLLFTVSLKQSAGNLKRNNNNNNNNMQNVALAFGGRFDNNVANYQMELHKYIPASVGVTLNCSYIAQAILIVEAQDSYARKQQASVTRTTQSSNVDFFIGSSGDTLTAQKIKLMRMLQHEQHGYRVHVDYSSDMYKELNKQFVEENNVRFLLVVQKDTNAILFADRLGYLSRWADLKPSSTDSYSVVLGGIQFTEYRDVHTLMHDFTTAKTRVKRQRERGINLAAAGSTNQSTSITTNNTTTTQLSNCYDQGMH